MIDFLEKKKKFNREACLETCSSYFLVKEADNANSSRVTTKNEHIHSPLANPFPITRTIANSNHRTTRTQERKREVRKIQVEGVKNEKEGE